MKGEVQKLFSVNSYHILYFQGIIQDHLKLYIQLLRVKNNNTGFEILLITDFLTVFV